MNNSSIKTLDMEKLSIVSGGTFTPNTYSKEAYHSIGICTSYKFFCGDEFKFMGKGISYDMANDIVKLSRKVHAMINTGAGGNNIIGYSEPAFIRSFNSQLKLNYGLVWDGKRGYDY